MLLDTEASAHTGALSSEQLNYLQEYRGRAARALTHGRLFAAPVELSVPFAHDHGQEHEQTGTGLPLEYVEWELKQAKEYMAKLKFGLLELTSKRVFLDKLMPSGTLPVQGARARDADATLSLYDEWTNCQTRWSPTDVKQLERQVDARKDALHAVKQRLLAVKQEIADGAEHVVGARDACEAVRRAGQAKARELAALDAEAAAVTGALAELAAQREATRPVGLSRCSSCEDASDPSAVAASVSASASAASTSTSIGQLLGLRSVDELQEELRTLEQQLHVRATTTHAHAQATEELRRAHAQLATDTAALDAEAAALTALLAAKQRRQDPHAPPDAAAPDADALEQLCVWHRTALDCVASLTAMRFEMLRPDYLLVSADAKGLALHLHIEPPTGRLLAARLHATSSVAVDLERAKAWCARAVDSNDITTLLHQLQLV